MSAGHCTARPQRLGALAACFYSWLDGEIAAGRNEEGTKRSYRFYIDRFVDQVGAETLLRKLIPWDLESRKTNWHSVYCVQRLFNWAQGMGLVKHNPFRELQRPPRGERQRVLTRGEMARLLLAAARWFRVFIQAMRHTMARPQELRALQWKHLSPDGKSFVLTDFKGKKRRKDGVKARRIMLDAWMQRFIGRRRRRVRSGEDYVFLNRYGKPLTGNAVYHAMKRTREKAGLVDGGEIICAYTMRHTAGTIATANGVRDRTLADLMGHASTRTTARYQHLQAEDLAAVVDAATAWRGAR